jgi:metallo-beta-lactamase family protein
MYSSADVEAMAPFWKTVPLHQRVDLGNDVGFTFFEAGHILGSAYVWLDWKEGGQTRTLFFTADVGRYDTPILRDPEAPPAKADVLITESTYGGKVHGPMGLVEPQFLALIQGIVKNGGRLLVPSFAVGRTQTMIYYVRKFVAEGKIPPIRTYVDSPMGVAITHAYREGRQDYDDETRRLIGEADLFGAADVTLARSSDESRRINADRGPCVIVASSPTCEFGRILHHLKQSVERPQDTVLFVGWTPPETLGRRLQDGERRVRIFDRWYDVKCQITTLEGMSAHADGDELVRFLRPAMTEQTRPFVVHGEPDQAELFAQRLVREFGADGAAVPAAYSTAFA